MKAEYLENKSCLQRDSAGRKEYAGARSIDNRETEEADGAELLERILNRAYERVKANGVVKNGSVKIRRKSL